MTATSTTSSAPQGAPVTSVEAVPSIYDAPPAAPVRPRVLIVGSAFGAAAVLMAFAGLLGIYLYQRSAAVSAGDAWIPQGVTIPLQQPTVMLFTLIAASVTVQWAVSAVANGDRINSYLALGLTFVFGFGFVNMGSYLYTLMELEVGASSQAVLIYTITGAQIAFVIAAMVFVAVTGFRALVGQETSRSHDGVSAAAIFWHANLAIFFLIWLVIYVTK